MNQVVKVKLKKDLPGIRAGQEFYICNSECKTIEINGQKFLWTDENFWEHIYEDCKVGDYITFIHNNHTETVVSQITKIADGFVSTDVYDSLCHKSEVGTSNSSWIIRKATPAEIKAYKSKIKIGRYYAEYKTGKVNFGCQEFTKDEVQTIRKYKAILQENDITDNITVKQLDQILNRI